MAKRRFFFDNEGKLKEEYYWYFEDLKLIEKALNQLIIAIRDGAIPATRDLIHK